MPDADDWVKPSDLAEREGISRRTAWNWVTKGLVEVRRQATRTGVRMRLPDAEKEKLGEKR